MKAIQFHEYGNPDVLRLDDIPVPKLGNEDVLIQVKAAGVNFSDTVRRRNLYPHPSPLPFIPGFEISGVVSQIGNLVQDISVGDRVVALMQGGGYAEFAAAHFTQVMSLPDEIDFISGAMLPVQGLTAFHLLKMARLQAKETIFIPAVAGGVGSLTLQLAKHLYSANVIGGASSKDKLEVAKSLGADSLLDYQDPNWPSTLMEITGGRGVDVILEMVGGDFFQKSLACLAICGRLAIYDRVSHQETFFDPITLLLRNQTVTGFDITWFLETHFQETVKPLKILFEWVNEGKVEIQSGGVFPFEESTEVHRLLESRRTTGKFILQP